ncbi:MAG: HEAT repeat domain-containing protein [Acidobacteria bacterium]|nr:HEAT repeat domain-containing protein [Acidobacteriota bacterium]
MRAAAAALLALPLALLPAAGATATDEEPSAPRDGAELLERLSAGPVVVLATALRVDGKLTLALKEVLRGGGLPETLRVAFRGNNLMRQPDTARFEARDGETAIYVLTPWVDSRGRQPKPDLYMPAGFAGARIPLPPEGGEALLTAVREIVLHQDDVAAGQEARVLGWISGRNPWLIDAGLVIAGQLVMADEDWVPTLLERMRDANPERRLRALAAAGGAMARGRIGDAGGGLEIDERVEACQEAVVRLARTDPEFEVRAAAVRIVAQAGIPGAREVLGVIAKDDPNQNVRYEAAAALVRGVRGDPAR